MEMIHPRLANYEYLSVPSSIITSTHDAFEVTAQAFFIIYIFFKSLSRQ